MQGLFPAILPVMGQEQPLGPSHPPCLLPGHQQLPWLLQAQKQSFQESQMSLDRIKHLDLVPRGPARC